MHQANPFSNAIIKEALLKIAPLYYLIPLYFKKKTNNCKTTNKITINSRFISDPITWKLSEIVP